MSKEPTKDGFTAEKCIFQCVPGYMLKQCHNGVVVCSQFIPEERFAEFCSAAGVIPVISE